MALTYPATPTVVHYQIVQTVDGDSEGTMRFAVDITGAGGLGHNPEQVLARLDSAFSTLRAEVAQDGPSGREFTLSRQFSGGSQDVFEVVE